MWLIADRLLGSDRAMDIRVTNKNNSTTLLNFAAGTC